LPRRWIEVCGQHDARRRPAALCFCRIKRDGRPTKGLIDRGSDRSTAHHLFLSHLMRSAAAHIECPAAHSRENCRHTLGRTLLVKQAAQSGSALVMMAAAPNRMNDLQKPSSSPHQPSLGCQVVECRVGVAEQRARRIQLGDSAAVQHRDPVAQVRPAHPTNHSLAGGACLVLSSTVLMRWAMVSTVQSANSRRMASWISPSAHAVW